MNFGLLGRSGTPEAGVLLGGALLQPQGRLALAPGEIAIADVAGATALYYTPAIGNRVPLFTGHVWKPVEFPEIAYQLQTANHLNNNNYDVFATLLFGKVAIGTGPAWSSGTARAAAGAIERFAGVPVNAGFLTLRLSPEVGATILVPPRQALLLGTFRTTANGQTTWSANPAPQAGGGDARLYLWNMFNRIDVAATSRESANTWTYTTASWRSANNSASNRVSLIRGLDEDAVDAAYHAMGDFDNLGSSPASVGVGVNSTTAPSGLTPEASRNTGGNNQSLSPVARYLGQPGLGLRFLQALEYGQSGVTFYGDNNNPSVYQAGLVVSTRM